MYNNSIWLEWSLKRPLKPDTVIIHDIDTLVYHEQKTDTLISIIEKIKWKTVTEWDTVYIFGTDTVIGASTGVIPFMMWGFDYDANTRKLVLLCNYGRKYVKHNIGTPIKVRMKKKEPFVIHGRRFPDLDVYLGWYHKTGFSAEGILHTNIWKLCINGKLESRKDITYNIGISRKIF